MKRMTLIFLLILLAVLAIFFTLKYSAGNSSETLPENDLRETDRDSEPEDSDDGVKDPKDVKETPKKDDGIEDALPITEEQVVGRVAIIIDDLGYSPNMDIILMGIEYDMTLAILPFLDGTEKAVDRFKAVNNFELILHLPLEPVSEDAHEEGMMMVDMESDEIVQLLDAALLDMKGAVEGVNNHKGSKFTSDRQSMEVLLAELKKRNLFFVDSFTFGSSIGYELSLEMGIPSARRNVFLDNVDDRESIRNRLHELENLSRERGYAIGIGHHKDITLEVLKEEMPAMESRGIEFVFVSELLK